MTKSIFSLLFFTLLIIVKIEAAHLIGGEITYECLGLQDINNEQFITLDFTAKMYRDCAGGGASFDNPANFYIFRGSGTNWTFVDVQSVFPDIDANVPVSNDPCVEPPPNVCLDVGTYRFDWQLPVVNESYMVVYQRCCRNNSILNIIGPESSGVSFSVEVSALAQSICNNSPQFNELPPAVICANQTLTFDHSASDVDGHTLTYEFCAPLEGGGLNGLPGQPGNANDCEGIIPDVSNCPPPYGTVTYKLPDFNAQNPLGINAGLTLDPNSGLLFGNPMEQGQFVVGICISEYLNGELIGKVQRDFQFNVTTCVISVEAGIQDGEVTGVNNLRLTQCSTDPMTIINESQDEDEIEGYLWRFFISNDTTYEYTTRDVTVPFPESGFYTGFMIVNPGVQGCSDTLFLEVDIFPEMEADFTFSFDTCVAEPISFIDESSSETGVILSWDWEFEPGEILNDQDPSYFFKTPGQKEVLLKSTDLNGCSDTIRKTLDYYPAPPIVVVEPSTFKGCSPAEIVFNNLSSPIDSSYTILWDFGDGNFGFNINEVHEYQEIGVYSVGIDIISPLGCEASRDYPFWIEVLPDAKANFIYSPENPKGDNLVMEFFDRSEDAISWQYIFDNKESIYQPNTSYTFDTIGYHFVDLIVRHPSGCSDTIRKEFIIEPTSSFFLPNAFSPNGDGINDIFTGKGDVNRISSFQLQIYARNGERVFSSDTPDFKWNGRIMNTGKELPSDLYVLKFQYIDPLNILVQDTRSVTLVR